MTIYWTIVIILPLIAIAAGETYALRTGKTTFSRFLWRMSLAWMPIVFLVGMVVGGLAVHILWPWCPQQGLGVG